MKSIPTLATTMTPFPHSIDVNQPIKDAMSMMDEHGFHHLPVTEDGDLVGVLSERDIRFLDSPFSSASLDDDLYVKDVYTSRAFVVDIHDSLEDVLHIMAEKHLGSALITKNGKLAGILTPNDVYRKFGELIHKLKARPDGNDAA